MDLITGKRVLITGATSGIGSVTALELARRGADLTIVCRNPDKGKSTATEIEMTVPGNPVDVLIADLSELDEVRRAAHEIHASYPVSTSSSTTPASRTSRPASRPTASTTCWRPTTWDHSC